MNNLDKKRNSKSNVSNDEKEKKIKTDFKVNRIHRITPTNNIKIKLFSGKKTNEINQKKLKSAPHLFSSAKHKKKEIYEEFYKEDIEKERKKRKNILNEFVLLYNEMRNNLLMNESNSNKHKDIIKNDNNSDKRENKYYYLINKTWFNQFKNYCQKKEISSSNINEDYPGQINNQHLILKDDISLKLNSEHKTIINAKYLDNSVCINYNLWNFLKKICGGGPEIKFIKKKSDKDIQNNENEVIIKAVHINLLFIPKKEIISNNNNKEPSNNLNNPLNPFQCQDIKKILINNDAKTKYKIQDIYFDINKNVQELTDYISQILNQHRCKFIDTPIYFGSNYNPGRNNCLINNINYRLWLNNIDTPPINILNYINEQINKYEDVDFLLQISQMDKFDNLNNIPFHPYLLSNFDGYKILDIFPNKYTKYFDNRDFYDTKYEDDNSFPTMTILIEEYPYHFDEPKKKYFIKKCNFCGYRDYVYYGCICQKVFYCSDACKKNDFHNHITTCKKGILKFFSEENEKLYRVILGRKEYYEKNKNDKENFPILGLANLGNSCYMNSSLQCLFAIKELTNYFLYYFKNDYINKENTLGTGGSLTQAYINLLLTINNTTNNKYLSPNGFKITLGLCSEKYEGNEQEDAHEFLNYLLDMLHEDLNKVKNKPKDNIINLNITNKSDEDKSIYEWNNFLKRNQSLLIDLLYGQFKSCVICPHCNYKSINFNTFLSLELPINENNDYVLINICFVDHLKESPFIYFSIILQKNEMTIFILRKKIANVLNIDILEFELASMNNNEIIHIYEIQEKIPNEINPVLYAFRVNPNYFFSPNNNRINEIIQKRQSDNININENIDENNYEKYKNINFMELKNNILRRKNDIIQFNENKNIINNDYLYFSLKYNDNIGLNNDLFQRCILQSFKMKNRKTYNLESDEVIYLEKNKNCKDIYLEIYRKYAFNIIYLNSDYEQRNYFKNIYNSSDIVKKNKVIYKSFIHYFKKLNFNSSKLNLKDNFPECPFVLFLKNSKYHITEVIPYSNIINYNDILNRFYDKINNAKIHNDEIQFDDENENIIDINEQNKDLNDYAETINNILLNNNYNMNDNRNNSDINTNRNENNNEYNGLKGGASNNNKRRKNSENENEESEESGNESDSNSDSDNDKNENENSEQDSENDNNTIIIDDISSNSYSNNDTKRSKIIDFENDSENLNDDSSNMNFIKKTEKDENIDKIIIMLNSKFIKEINRFNDIDLCDKCNKMYEKIVNQEVSIEKCFEEFSKEEKLDSENLWKCPNCNDSLQAIKKIEIYNAPKILIIHLKRFTNNKKKNTFISFPLENLEIDKYINKPNKENNKYDLFGVINHYGTLGYGHYTAFCKNYHDNNWYEYNDKIVKKIQDDYIKNTIVNKNAYILFYREKKNDFIKWENIYNKEYEDINENNLKKYGEDFIYETITNIEIIDTEHNKEENKIDLESKYNKIDSSIIEEDFQIPENYAEIEKDDDNFSFKEATNNIIEEENKEEKIQNNINDINEIQTPKFKNMINNLRIKSIEEDINKDKKISKKLDFNESNEIPKINQSSNNKEDNKVSILNQSSDKKVDNEGHDNIKYQTQVKDKDLNQRETLYKTLPKSKDNIIRITTYKKNRKNKNKLNSSSQNNNNGKNIEPQDKNISNFKPTNEDKNNSEINPPSIQKENDLLQYDIFNMSKNYFKMNLKKENKPFKSVKSKDLSNFILREYSDNVSDKVPRSKKLYEDSNMNTENKPNSIFIFNNKNNESNINVEKLVAIKEEVNDNINYVSKNDIDLDCYIYNPFRNCYAKPRKF